jgi:ubiquinol-cytochrome c reductase iron-sulfur subunit
VSGALGLLYPLINQMNPSADVLALASIEVDISKIAEGQSIKTIWRKQPIFDASPHRRRDRGSQ